MIDFLFDYCRVLSRVFYRGYLFANSVPLGVGQLCVLGDREYAIVLLMAIVLRLPVGVTSGELIPHLPTLQQEVN